MEMIRPFMLAENDRNVLIIFTVHNVSK